MNMWKSLWATLPAAILCLALGGLFWPHRTVVSAGSRILPVSVAFDGGAAMRFDRLAASADDLYVRNGDSYRVTRYMLNGMTRVEEFTNVLHWKEGDNGLIIGRPVDLFLSGERLLVLDDRGSLWSYWGPNFGRVIVPLRLQSNQGNVDGIALRGTDLLVLDPDRRQIWRYPLVNGGYDTVPRPLFPHPSPALATATRLAVTRDALLAVRRDGRVVRIPWTQPSRAGLLPLAEPVVGLSTSPSSDQVLVATAHDVVLLAPDGTVRWRSAIAGLNGEAIQDIAVNPAGRLYVLTPTRILRVTGPAFSLS